MSGEEPALQMTLVESPHVVSSVKILILKKVPPKTAQALLQRQKERKAKSILLLAIPDECQLRFHGTKDAKTLWAVIKRRFGGNVESKKMQKNVLKQQFENFYVSDTEGLDKAYDRFQKLISLLEVHSAAVSNEDANQKSLRALPSSWNNIYLIMRNKEGIDELDINDLYNNLKVFEADIKASHSSQGQASSHFKNTDGSNVLIFIISHIVQNDDGDSRADCFDKNKVECFNLLLLGSFTGVCSSTKKSREHVNRDAGYLLQGLTPAGTIPVKSSVALVVQDNDFDYTDTRGLESVEAQLIVHQKNEAVYEEKITVLEFEVKDKAVSTVKGNGITAVKASAGYVWRPKKTDLNNGSNSKIGNPQQALKYKGMFNSRCSRHMTGNKALLTDYQDIDGGFVAFGGSTRGGKITVTAGNQTNKNAGPQETNGNTGLKKNVDAGQTEEENDDTVDDDACKLFIQELASEYDQALKNVLDKMMDQEKEATEQSDAVRKEFEAQCDSQLL
ncbi:hypothetical protein Tco_0832311 [Tanacetum coccineum]